MFYTLLRSFLLITVTIAFSTQANAQQRRQVAHTQVCIDVYDMESVDRQPQFPGGDTAMLRFINNERRYPAEAYHDGIQGRVLCSFVVSEDGSLTHISVIRGVEESLDREAVRIISEMPKWMAGEIDDTPVPVYCILPIPFRR